MSNQLTEQQVLDELNIPDFRHMSKDKVMSFTSMLSNMEPQVAMKALEQFPEFSKTIIEIASDYKAKIHKCPDRNSESMKACSDILQSIIESFQNQLEREEIPFEERKYYIDKMFEVEQRMAHSDNKEFIIRVMQIAGGAALVLGSIALLAIGKKADFKLPFKK